MNVLELDPQRREALLSDARRLVLARGELLYTPGDPAGDVFVVERGRIKVLRTMASGSEAIVEIRNPGDVFGEMIWLAEKGRRTTSAVALDPSEVRSLDGTLFGRRLRADATLAASFARGLAARLAATERELTELAGKSVPGRLVDILGRLAAEHGVAEPEGGVRIGLSLTHQDLANLIGTSRETLTKELGVLADAGLLRVSHRSLVLLQPQAFPFARRRT
ncbi:MAG: Crp/Fnr family transcriptional regulator [Candidatus Baltobacteraceae bacterium]